MFDVTQRTVVSSSSLGREEYNSVSPTLVSNVWYDSRASMESNGQEINLTTTIDDDIPCGYKGQQSSSHHPISRMRCVLCVSLRVR